MHIQIHQYGKKFGFELMSGTHSIMQSTTTYTRKRAAVAKAKQIAGSKIKVAACTK